MRGSKQILRIITLASLVEILRNNNYYQSYGGKSYGFR